MLAGNIENMEEKKSTDDAMMGVHQQQQQQRRRRRRLGNQVSFMGDDDEVAVRRGVQAKSFYNGGLTRASEQRKPLNEVIINARDEEEEEEEDTRNASVGTSPSMDNDECNKVADECIREAPHTPVCAASNADVDVHEQHEDEEHAIHDAAAAAAAGGGGGDGDEGEEGGGGDIGDTETGARGSEAGVSDESDAMAMSNYDRTSIHEDIDLHESAPPSEAHDDDNDDIALFNDGDARAYGTSDALDPPSSSYAFAQPCSLSAFMDMLETVAEVGSSVDDLDAAIKVALTNRDATAVLRRLESIVASVHRICATPSPGGLGGADEETCHDNDEDAGIVLRPELFTASTVARRKSRAVVSTRRRPLSPPSQSSYADDDDDDDDDDDMSIQVQSACVRSTHTVLHSEESSPAVQPPSAPVTVPAPAPDLKDLNAFVKKNFQEYKSAAPDLPLPEIMRRLSCAFREERLSDGSM